MKKFWKYFVGGIVIGIGSAIAGVSGSALAVVLKIYEDIIFAFSNIFKKFKNSFLVLLPTLIGVAVAMVPCIIIFKQALQYLFFGLASIFAGMLIGSLPGIFDEVKGAKLSFKKPGYIIALIIGFAIIVTLGVLSIVLNFDFQFMFEDPHKYWYLFLILIPVGFLAAAAVTIPGISGGLIILVLGFYKPIVFALVNWTAQGFGGQPIYLLYLFLLFLSFGGGVIAGILVFSKLAGYLLTKHRHITYWAIIGFVIGSIVALYVNQDMFNYYCVWAGQTIEFVTPILPMWAEMLIAAVLLGGSIVGSYQLVRAQRKAKKAAE